jgi:hypothetical protein
MFESRLFVCVVWQIERYLREENATARCVFSVCGWLVSPGITRCLHHTVSTSFQSVMASLGPIHLEFLIVR